MWWLFFILFSPVFAVEDEIRSYLLSHPEVVSEALELHRAQLLEAKFTALVTEQETQIVVDNPDGEHVLVAFVDYRCGACRRTYPWVASFLQSHPDVKLVIKPLPVLGGESTTASLLLYDAAEVGEATSVHTQLMQMNINAEAMHQLAKKHQISAYGVNDVQKHWAFKYLEKNYQDSVGVENQSVPLYVLSVNGKHEVFQGLSSKDDLVEAYQKM